MAFALVDPQFAKDQLWLLLFEQFQHPNGQIPAYEWEFSDLNPPVHAWAVWRVYNMDRIRQRQGRPRVPRAVLPQAADQLRLVGQQGRPRGQQHLRGRLPRPGQHHRRRPQRAQLPTAAVLEQADATGWMGMFCLNLMRIALELAKENRVYESLATKFFQHYAYVASAMKHMGNRDYQLWDEKDGFFYDVLRYPDGSFHKFRVRSLVGLIPLFAVERLEMSWTRAFKDFTRQSRMVHEKPLAT